MDKRKKIIAFITALLLLILIVVGWGRSFIFHSSLKTAEKQLEKKSREVNDKMLEINYSQERLNDKYYEEKITKLLSKNELLALGKKQFKYTITVNGEEMKSASITTKERNVTIRFSEGLKSGKTLPDAILKQSSLTAGDKKDRFYEHAIIKASVPYKQSFKTENFVTEVTYSFEKIANPTIITVIFSEPLKERLDVPYDSLSIIVQ